MPKGVYVRPKGEVTRCPHTDREHYAKGYCHSCYETARAKGHPATTSNAYCSECKRYLFLTAYDVEVCPGCGNTLYIIGKIPSIGRKSGPGG